MSKDKVNTQRISLLVGSKNPVKIAAAKAAFSQAFTGFLIECQGVQAPSGVPDQPMTSQQTQNGAVNRVDHCAMHYPNHDYYIAMEGGVDLFDHGPATFAYVAIKSIARLSIGRGANLPLPPSVYKALQAGEELGDVMDRLFNTDNIKQKGGAISLLTKGLATRESNYQHALILALAPIINPELYDE